MALAVGDSPVHRGVILADPTTVTVHVQSLHMLKLDEAGARARQSATDVFVCVFQFGLTFESLQRCRLQQRIAGGERDGECTWSC